MTNIIKIDNKNLVGFFHRHNGDLAIPQPFERDIFLFDTYIAGTSHIEGIDELEPYLHIDDRLDFVREPDNHHDPQAIAVRTVSGAKVGYVPKADNIIFSRLMDGGKQLFGKITAKEWKGKWLKIAIDIYLHEV